MDEVKKLILAMQEKDLKIANLEKDNKIIKKY